MSVKVCTHTIPRAADRRRGASASVASPRLAFILFLIKNLIISRLSECLIQRIDLENCMGMLEWDALGLERSGSKVIEDGSGGDELTSIE